MVNRMSKYYTRHNTNSFNAGIDVDQNFLPAVDPQKTGPDPNPTRRYVNKLPTRSDKIYTRSVKGLQRQHVFFSSQNKKFNK